MTSGFWLLVALVVALDLAMIFGPLDTRDVQRQGFWHWLTTWRVRKRPPIRLDDWAPTGAWMLPTALGAVCLLGGVLNLLGHADDLPDWAWAWLIPVGATQAILTALYLRRPIRR